MELALVPLSVAVFAPGSGTQRSNLSSTCSPLEIIMQWSKPEYTDLRFGFEITMYIANR